MRGKDFLEVGSRWCQQSKHGPDQTVEICSGICFFESFFLFSMSCKWQNLYNVHLLISLPTCISFLLATTAHISNHLSTTLRGRHKGMWPRLGQSEHRLPQPHSDWFRGKPITMIPSLCPHRDYFRGGYSSKLVQSEWILGFMQILLLKRYHIYIFLDWIGAGGFKPKERS